MWEAETLECEWSVSWRSNKFRTLGYFYSAAIFVSTLASWLSGFLRPSNVRLSDFTCSDPLPHTYSNWLANQHLWTSPITTSTCGLKINSKISYVFNWCPICILKIYLFLCIHTIWNHIHINWRFIPIISEYFSKRPSTADIHVVKHSPSLCKWRNMMSGLELLFLRGTHCKALKYRASRPSHRAQRPMAFVMACVIRALYDVILCRSTIINKVKHYVE